MTRKGAHAGSRRCVRLGLSVMKTACSSGISFGAFLVSFVHLLIPATSVHYIPVLSKYDDDKC